MGVFSAEELDLLERAVARFITEGYGAGRRRELAAEGGFGRAEWRSFAELGWLGIAVPPEHGGLGGGLTDQLALLEGAGRGLLLEPLVSTLVVGTGLIGRLGSAAQRAAWLPRIGAGEVALGFAHSPDGAGRVDASVRSTWNAHRGGFCLSGRKRAVLHGPHVDRLLVTARDREGAARVFMVPADAPGLAWTTYRMIDDQVAGDIELDDVMVALEDCLDSSAVEPALARALAAAAVAAAAESVGAMEALHETTLAYAKVRKQFGRSLGSFQVLRHRLVDMRIATRKARALARSAAAALEDDAPDALRLAAACKVVAGRAGRFVGEQAIQIHGGIGMTDEYAAGHYFKRLLLLGTRFGDADHHLSQLAAALPGAE